MVRCGMTQPVGREKVIAQLRRSQRAASVGRLLLGKVADWNDYLSPERTDFSLYGRRDLKANRSRFRSSISKEIQKFCESNFDGMSEAKLEKLYLKVKERRGVEMPLKEFEASFAKLKSSTLGGAPRHSTVVVSLWGLQLKFPEAMLSKDIIEAVRLLHEAQKELQPFETQPHSRVVSARDKIGSAVRQQEFASRTCLLACFNLVEAALNGLAWDFAEDASRMDAMSGRQKKLVEDGKFKDKLLKYPELISGNPLWDENDERVRYFLDEVQPYRDAIVHASPFSKPERYGGLDKLEHFYRIDAKRAQEAASRTVLLLVDLFRHVRSDKSVLPPWLEELLTETDPRR